MYKPRSRSLKAYSSTWVKNRLNSTRVRTQPSFTPLEMLNFPEGSPFDSTSSVMSLWNNWMSVVSFKGSQASWGSFIVHFCWPYQMLLSNLWIQNRVSHSVQGTFLALVLQWRSCQQHLLGQNPYWESERLSSKIVYINLFRMMRARMLLQQRAMRCLCNSLSLLLCICFCIGQYHCITEVRRHFFFVLPRYWQRLHGMPSVTPHSVPYTILQVFHPCHNSSS